MPLGDPMGGEHSYGDIGKLSGIWIASIPVSDLDSAIEFYREVLGLDVVLDRRDHNWVELGRQDELGNIALYEPSPFDKRQPGGPTGVIFRTDSIYDVHKRLVDSDVTFSLRPQRQDWGGLLLAFLDDDGNQLTVMEDPEHYSRSVPDEEKHDIGGDFFKDRTSE
jgi:catechol 2,3-dioxygenase-like lactoylglutathione lyase family enzyme